MSHRTLIIVLIVSMSPALRGSAGGAGGAGDVEGDRADADADGTRLGGGAKSFVRLNAGGVGGATCAGGACFAAVEWRSDVNMFLPELMSTSPNFCGRVIRGGSCGWGKGKGRDARVTRVTRGAKRRQASGRMRGRGERRNEER